MTRPLLVIGSSGQLARAFKALSPDAVFLDRTAADLSSPETVAAVLKRYNPHAIVNAAAYTQVDNAEAEEQVAMAVNAQSPAAMAAYCHEKNIPFMHFSTDYVFNGSGEKPWHEDDVPAPLNAYGRSKLAGENRIAEIGGQYLIFRTSWVYDAAGKNFMNTILRLAAEREELKVIADQFGAPTFALHLANASLAALARAADMPEFPSGVYHLCGGGVTSWHGFATLITEKAHARGMKLKVQRILPIPATEYQVTAPRPYNSRLDCSKALSMFDVSLPSWRDGLEACMESKA